MGHPNALLLLLSTVLGLGLASPSVMAQGGQTGAAGQDPAKARATALAKKHAGEGKNLFNLGLFKEAAREYERAYRIRPVPDLLFNLAQCYRRLGNIEGLERALHYYEAYRNSAPNLHLLEQAKKDSDELKAEIETLKREREAEKRRKRPFYTRWWFWTAVGVVVAGATVAATVTAAQPGDPVEGTADPGILQLPVRGLAW